MGWREKELAKLADKKVLMVGAGGIGCELLKNIVLAGFRDIHVVDLDTIDVSNLNRQFLFHREHVGRAKADVATEAGLRMAREEGVKITFDHDSIFSEKFNFEFFKQFFLVLNALDNKAARNHVNRMCIATKVPFVEGGSSGYLGQVYPIVRGLTECYECAPPTENVKTYPGCTIRNTPSEHIHCTVWAKHVFNQLFGEIDFEDDVSPDMDDENAKDATAMTNGVSEMEVEAKNKPDNDVPMNGEAEAGGEGKAEEKPGNTRAMAEASGYDPERIFNKLFVEDIKYLLKMTHLWKERRPPQPTPMDELATANASSSTTAEAHAAELDPHQRVWTPCESGAVFTDCVKALRDRKAASPDGILTWDKDDDEAMKFVAACANIRAGIFGIPLKSLFEIKSMAGNIIPAIATTNAIIAGAMVVEALKMVSGNLAGLRNIRLTTMPLTKGDLLSAYPPEKPKPVCYVCSRKREVVVRVNVDAMTLGSLQDKVLKESLGVEAPDVIEASSQKIIISSEPGETDGLMGDKLSAHGLASGGRLNVEDFESGEELRLVILQAAAFAEEQFEVVSDEMPEQPVEEEAKPRKRHTLEPAEGEEGEGETAVPAAKKARKEEDGGEEAIIEDGLMAQA